MSCIRTRLRLSVTAHSEIHFERAARSLAGITGSDLVFGENYKILIEGKLRYSILVNWIVFRPHPQLKGVEDIGKAFLAVTD